MASKQPPAASGWPPWTPLDSGPVLGSILKALSDSGQGVLLLESICLCIGQYSHNFPLNSSVQINDKVEGGGWEGEREQDTFQSMTP